MPERDRRDGAGLRDVLGELLGRGVWSRGVALGRLSREWHRVVGDRLAEECAPVALDAGGLLVRASTAAWATQIRFLADEIAVRANDVLGKESVRAVRVVVEPDRRG